MADSRLVAIADRKKLKPLDLPSTGATWFGITELRSEPDQGVIVIGEIRYEKTADVTYCWEGRGRLMDGRCFLRTVENTASSERLPIGSPVRIAHFAGALLSRLLGRLQAQPPSKEAP